MIMATKIARGYSVASHLSAYALPRSEFIATQSGITDFVVGGIMFADMQMESKCMVGDQSIRVLVLQRAESDVFPGKWDFPGGRFETSDDTMLDAVAREVNEETGLRLTMVYDFVGTNYWEKEHAPGRKWAKFSFVVGVAEMDQGVNT
ncbi:MAG: hypothetical protein Q9159_000740 [Coniocarpon cinnabarinum]